MTLSAFGDGPDAFANAPLRYGRSTDALADLTLCS
jgi:hypothetical protein